MAEEKETQSTASLPKANKQADPLQSKSLGREEVEQEAEETKQEAEVKKSANEEKKEIEVPKHLKSLVKELEDIKLIDLAELVKVLEDRFGVSAAPVAVAAIPAGGTSAGDTEQGGKAAVNVVLTGAGEKKIEVIKAIKEITQKGLKECKDLVDAVVNDPQIVKEKVKSEEAEEMKKKLEAAGAVVELK